MAIDPQARALLDVVHAPGAPPVESQTVDQARAGLRALAAMGRPEPVDAVDETTVGGAAGPLPARSYRPAGAGAGPLPVLVWFHGGGWVVGDLDTADETCRQLANRAGCLVVSVGYRLAPEAPFPAAVDDALAATAWVAAHAAELGADPGRLAVGGDSAGGNLAAVACLLARDRGGPPIAFQLLVYPATDLRFGHPSVAENGEGKFLTAGAMAWFTAHYLGEDGDVTDWRASPLLAPDLAGLPPAYVATAEYDPLRDEGEAYAARLADAGVPVTARRADRLIHGFFSMSSVIEAAGAAIDEAAAVLRAALAGNVERITPPSSSTTRRAPGRRHRSGRTGR